MHRYLLLLLFSLSLYATQWEYASLVVRDNGSIEFVSNTEMIKEEVKVQAKKLETYQAAYEALAVKISGKKQTNAVNKQLLILDVLGEKGWELLDMNKHGLFEEYLFKRKK